MKYITEYFPELTEFQIGQFSKLKSLYSDWNEKINVISRKDMNNFYSHHVLHSLAIAKIIKFKKDTKVLDVGTGGGFPGIPLAIMFPDVDFLLIDSIGKKIKVVDAVKESLYLSNVHTMHVRAENVEEKFDFIVSRAVTSFPQFLNFVKGKVSKKSFNDIHNGILYLKGGDFKDEIAGLKNVSVSEISDFFEDEFFETKKIIFFPK